MPVPAQEAGGGDVATALRALEYKWAEAQARNDNRALDLIFDNDLVYIEYGQLMTKGDYLLRVRSAKPQLAQIVMEAMTVHTSGSTAIVVGTYRETGVKDRKSVPKRWRFVDTWVNKKGSWMLVAAAAAPLSK
jgi:ketosteroid isomerase-like protein